VSADGWRVPDASLSQPVLPQADQEGELPPPESECVENADAGDDAAASSGSPAGSSQPDPNRLGPSFMVIGGQRIELPVDARLGFIIQDCPVGSSGCGGELRRTLERWNSLLIFGGNTGHIYGVRIAAADEGVFDFLWEALRCSLPHYRPSENLLEK